MAVNLLLTARFFRQLWYLPLTALTLKFYPLSFLILPLQWPYYPMFFFCTLQTNNITEIYNSLQLTLIIGY